MKIDKQKLINDIKEKIVIPYIRKGMKFPNARSTATELDLDYSFFSKWWNGKREIGINCLKKICKKINKNPEDYICS